MSMQRLERGKKHAGKMTVADVSLLHTVHMSAYLWTCIVIPVRVFVHCCLSINAYACVSVHSCLWTCVCAHVYAHVYAHLYAQLYAHLYAHVYAHVCTYKHTVYTVSLPFIGICLNMYALLYTHRLMDKCTHVHKCVHKRV